MAYFWASGVWW